MQTQTITFEYLDGYKIETIKEKMSLEQAVALLSSKAQHKYSSAVRCGSDVEVSSHIWTCPYCGERVPAYQEYFFGRPKKSKGRRKANSLRGSEYQKIPRDKIASLIEEQAQITFFDTNNKILTLNRPIGDIKTKCPRCGKVSSKYTQSKQITFTKKKHLFEITAECDIKDVLSAKWISKMWEEVEFPVYETATFNFKKGRVYLSFHSEDWEKVYTVSDVTGKAEIWTSGAIHSAFATYKAVQRNFKRAFLNYYPNGFPFDKSDLTLEKYVCLARFIGYPRNFYYGIPFRLCTTRLDNSFKKIGRILHNASDLEKVYLQSGLPQKSKTIRKIFFENPALFFYIDECVFMNKILNDVNLFRRLLSDGNIFEILVQIHIFPGMNDFLADYAKFKGTKELVCNLLNHRFFVFYEAVIYSAMSPEAKKIKQAKWKTKVFGRPELDDFEAIVMDDPGVPLLQRVHMYSIPMHPIDKSITDFEIDSFSFRWLVNASDYYRVGIELNNCLTGWSPNNHPVVAVYKKNVAVAAIEINTSKEDRGIVQVRTIRNGDIAGNPRLNKAFVKWKQRFNLDETNSF